MNDGVVDVGPFGADAQPAGSRHWTFEGLPAGATYTRGETPFDFTHVVLDPDDRVAERDERDNELFTGIPTPPPFCATVRPRPSVRRRPIRPCCRPSRRPSRRLSRRASSPDGGSSCRWR